MGIILWIIFGALVGWSASALMGTSEGLMTDIIVGIIGAFLGGALMSLIGKSDVTGFNVYSFLVALLGACLFIAIVRRVRS
jgi:uncharacterized membrane protein YeaQ/YmgE (transglycosylase-associated protein family)